MKNTLLLIFTFLSIATYGQHLKSLMSEGYAGAMTISHGGGILKSANGSIAFNAGEYVMLPNGDANMKTGFQNMVFTSVGEMVKNIYKINVFPNPATDFLTVSVKSIDNQNYTLFLYDIWGRLIQTKTIENGNTQIAITNCASGIYMVKITSLDNQLLKVFKIVKY